MTNEIPYIASQSISLKGPSVKQIIFHQKYINIVIIILFFIISLLLTAGYASDIPLKEWEKTFGALGIDVGNCVKSINDSGYIITGQTSSCGSGARDLWLIRTD
jgi:hypothetical protein